MTGANEGNQRRGLWAGLLSHAYRLIILVVGSTVLLIGVVMIVTPGPAFLVIPLGLGILAIEFVWARRLLQRMRDEIAKRMPQKQTGHADDSESGCGVR